MSEDARTQPQSINLPDQLELQAKMIQELTDQIQQKESKLAELPRQALIIDELTDKLHETEAANDLAYQQVQTQVLLIEELTEKIQEVEIQLTASFMQNQHTIAQNILKTHIVAGMALGFLPLPMLDMAASSGVQANLLRNLCKHYQVDFDEQISNCILPSMVRGSLPVLIVMSLSSIVKIIPGIGTLGGGISMTLVMGATVYATGQVFIRHFETGGTLQNFNNKHWQAFFKEQFEVGKAFVKANRIKD